MNIFRAHLCRLASFLVVSACSANSPVAPASQVVGFPSTDPCPTSYFLVAFATESANAQDNTSEVLDAAAGRARVCGSEVVVVSRGYAETATLAERRARVAYEGLIARGVHVRDGAVIACPGSAEERAIVSISSTLITSPDHSC